MLAKFVLLRWDQLDELAVRLKGAGVQNEIDEDKLKEALERLAIPSSWAYEAPYIDFVDDLRYPRRDFTRS